MVKNNTTFPHVVHPLELRNESRIRRHISLPLGGAPLFNTFAHAFKQVRVVSDRSIIQLDVCRGVKFAIPSQEVAHAETISEDRSVTKNALR